MNEKQIQDFSNEVSKEARAFGHFLSEYNAKKQNSNAHSAFDSVQYDFAQNGQSLPKSLELLLNSKGIQGAGQAGKNAIFDGLAWGTEAYKKAHNGAEPPISVIQSAFDTAVQSATEYSSDATIAKQFDSLSLSGHEATSVVPNIVAVTIMNAIAYSLPIVAQLPNPIGSNEVPLVMGRTTTNMRMGAMNKGDFIDGDKAGQPYLENRHTLTLTKAGDTFSTDVHVGYTKAKSAKGAVKYTADTNTPKAPFLGGRVSVFVKGVEVANDTSRQNTKQSGTTVLQQIDGEAVTIDGKKYLIKTGLVNLDTHNISVTFDGAETVPDADEVTVHVVFDYERKDPQGQPILTAPGLDMAFIHKSIFASPMRALVTASIDAITQMQNELGISWQGAVVAVVQQKFYLEQNARLLREAYNSAVMQSKRVQTFDAQKQGITFHNLADMTSSIRAKIGLAKSTLASDINIPVHAVDLYVDDLGAAFLSALPDTMYRPSNLPFGVQNSIVQIGSLSDGTGVYYLPKSCGVIESAGANTASMLLLPKSSTPAYSPFVGHTAVAPMVLTAKPNAFEEQSGTYSRTAAQRNPYPQFANQAVVIQLINLPNL